MTIDCLGFPMGFFVGRTEDGRIVFGKRDPITKEVLEIYFYESPLENEKKALGDRT